MPDAVKNRVGKPLPISARPSAGATAVASAVAMPNMPMPSAKRVFGMTSVAMVLEVVFEQASDAPWSIRKNSASASACAQR